MDDALFPLVVLVTYEPPCHLLAELLDDAPLPLVVLVTYEPPLPGEEGEPAIPEVIGLYIYAKVLLALRCLVNTVHPLGAGESQDVKKLRVLQLGEILLPSIPTLPPPSRDKH